MLTQQDKLKCIKHTNTQIHKLPISGIVSLAGVDLSPPSDDQDPNVKAMAWQGGANNVGRASDDQWQMGQGGNNVGPYPIFRRPTNNPTAQPTNSPVRRPLRFPTRYPTAQPTDKPTRRPIRRRRPTNNPTAQPTNSPVRRPLRFPTRYPTAQPTNK
jgi:hypothetical protein